VALARGRDGKIEASVAGELVSALVESPLEARAREQGRQTARGHVESEVRAPMPGKVIEIGVVVGDRVEEGTKLVVLEAMKMENEIRARGPGKVMAVHVSKGQAVDGGALVMEIDGE
jgi:biotin carboxyl carrier protein